MTAPPYDELLASRGMLLLAREEGRSFIAPGTRPDWFHQFLPDDSAVEKPFDPGVIFPFMDHFLEDAAAFWEGGEPGELRSGIWTETSPAGDELQFEAIACKARGQDYLFVRRLTTGFDQLHRVFQKGRDLALTHERLLAEIGKKEILLHCIVHDIAGPLQGMMSALQIAKTEKQSDSVKRFIDLGLLAAKQQSNLIGDLLDAFRAEVSSISAIPADPASAPDVISCAREVIEVLQPAFAIRERSGEVIPPAGIPAQRVVAEKSRLERVFHNLLQNAMRHSPRSGAVTITFRDEDEYIRIAIEDQGPGVPPEVAPQLFQKFVRLGSGAGRAGLGLFFCRITVEQWGGAIGCEPRPGGGATFWFRLKKA